MAKKSKIKFHISLNSTIIIGCFIIVFFYIFQTQKPNIIEGYKYNEVIENYGKEIDLYANIENLPPSYFKALTILECSGKKDFPHRFEPHIYKKLIEIKKGKKIRFENITQKQLIDISDTEIRNLATSWGPFQIMGYKCLELNITISELKGSDAVFWGVKWINASYGNLLRKGLYKDAFHTHNTGKPFPKNNKPFTHDPQYVENGLKYMSHF